MHAYRIVFNLVALLTVIPPLWLVYRWQGAPLWSWQGVWALLANGAALLASVLLIWSLRHYDGADFSGFRQLTEKIKKIEDLESLKISPLHRYVRHPWYSLGLVLIWTRDMNAAWLLSALLITLYLVVGSRLEEHKLLALHGESYRIYQDKVPALVPLPGKRLTAAEGEMLVKMAASTK